MTTSKAWAAALATLIAAFAAQFFGVGDMPGVQDLNDAVMALATSAGMAVASWVVTYLSPKNTE